LNAIWSEKHLNAAFLMVFARHLNPSGKLDRSSFKRKDQQIAFIVRRCNPKGNTKRLSFAHIRNIQALSRYMHNTKYTVQCMYLYS